METDNKKPETPVLVHRYSNHPIVQEKLAGANDMLAKANMSFLDTAPKKQ